jgi:hypothetical protein
MSWIALLIAQHDPSTKHKVIYATTAAITRNARLNVPSREQA